MVLAVVLLVFNWKVNRNALFLSLLMVLIASCQTRQYLELYPTDPIWLALFINNPAALWSMIGPCLFFYVRNVLTDRFTFRKSDWLHTIPFWVTLAGTLPYILTPFSYKLHVAYLNANNLDAAYHVRYNWLMGNKWNLLFRSVVQVAYALVCLWMVAGFPWNQRQDVNRSMRKGGLIRKWLVAVSVFVLLAGLYYFTGAFLFFMNPSLALEIVNGHYGIHLFGFALTALPSVVLVFPEILYGIPLRTGAPEASMPAANVEQTSAVEVAALPAVSEAVETEPQASGGPTIEETDPMEELGRRVLTLMERDKPYLNRDFSIEDLSDMLGVPRHHIYYCFKNVLKTKFVNLRTEYRVKEAKKRLLETDTEQTTLYAIGRSCGFSSHTAFYRTFHEVVGCSPGEFIERSKTQ